MHGSWWDKKLNAGDLDQTKEKFHQLIFVLESANLALQCLLSVQTTLAKIDAIMAIAIVIAKQILKTMAPATLLIVRDIDCTGTKSGVSIILSLVNLCDECTI